MKAMILAAGVGSRLGGIGKQKPKCLLEAGGKTMLEHVLVALKGCAVNEVCINTHHLAKQIEDFVQSKSAFGISVKFSPEKELLGTGGGLKQAQDVFHTEKYFILHNADVYCELDLNKLCAAHANSGALATLAVMARDSSRSLLFDEKGTLVGWDNRNGASRLIAGAKSSRRLGFCGIQVISAEVFKFMQDQTGAFSIIETYMLAAAAGKKIAAFEIKDSYWIDIGTPERLEELQSRLGDAPLS